MPSPRRAAVNAPERRAGRLTSLPLIAESPLLLTLVLAPILTGGQDPLPALVLSCLVWLALLARVVTGQPLPARPNGYLLAAIFPALALLSFLTSANRGATVIQALVKSGVQGIVFAGTGAGGLSSFEKSALKALVPSVAEGGPVLVRSSRVGNGRVIGTDVYDSLGMVPADTLNPQKARILLMLALTRTHDRSQITRIFAEY